MRLIRVVLIASLAMGVHGVASAALVEVGPFSGSLQESFEEYPPYESTGSVVYLPPRTEIFGGDATITGSPIVIYQYGPFGYPNYFGTAGGRAQVEDGIQGLGGTKLIINFQRGVNNFGGYFADNNFFLHFTFLDKNGYDIGDIYQPRLLTRGQLTWYGWTSKLPIYEVKIDGGNTAMDALQANPVPEPATWAMTILGLSGIGASLRRRRALAPA